MTNAQQAPVQLPLPSPPDLYRPSPRLAELRGERPVTQVRLPDGRLAWLVTRYADVRQVLVDTRFSRAAAAGTPLTGLSRAAADSILGMDPPEHTRLRRLVTRAFTVRRVEELRPKVIGIVTELLDGMTALPRPVDLVEHFSLPLPVRVICELLGVPATDRKIFHGWSDMVMGDQQSDPAVVEEALRHFGVYFASLIAEKRAKPADDLMTALISARDDDDRLSEHELVNLCLSILVAGHETTANQINMSLLTLLRYPEQMALLRDRPEAFADAVEELMRFVQLGNDGIGLPRITTEPVELGGVTIPTGATVLTSVLAANRDPDRFRDPDRLDLGRPENGHLGFGAGVHHCLGAQLARMELQEALRGLLVRMPGIRVTVPESELRFKHGMVIRSLESLPVTW